MSKPIQLLPGLQAHFTDDATWLYFEGIGHKSAINLEHIGNEMRHSGIHEWCERIRNSALGRGDPSPER
jgi:hypothetical protein